MCIFVFCVAFKSYKCIFICDVLSAECFEVLFDCVMCDIRDAHSV